MCAGAQVVGRRVVCLFKVEFDVCLKSFRCYFFNRVLLEFYLILFNAASLLKGAAVTLYEQVFTTCGSFNRC